MATVAVVYGLELMPELKVPNRTLYCREMVIVIHSTFTGFNVLTGYYLALHQLDQNYK